MKRLVLLTAAGSITLGSESLAQTATPPSRTTAIGAGNAENGKDVYLKYSCYACHGYAGHGGAASRLVPMRLSLSAFSSFVRKPASMPPYTAKVLSEEQLADVWAYVRTLPESPPARTIGLLNQQ